MASILSALLSLGLFLGQGIGDEDTFTKPSLWAEPGTLVSVGTNVSLWCRGPAGTKQYSVSGPKGSEDRSPSWPLTKVEFPISSVTKEDAGHYCCHYCSQSHRSPCSHPVELVVTGIYEKPTLLALPSTLVGSGEGVTLQCMAESRFDRFALYKEGDDHSSSGYEWKSQANFSIPVVTRTHEGTYRCYSFSSDFPYHWSAPSDSVKVIVTEISPRPETQDDAVGTSSGVLTLWEGILIGVSLLFSLIFLFGLLLCYSQHLARLKTEGREAEGMETLTSFSPTRAMQEQTLYTAVKSSTRNRPEDPSARDLQEVTCTPLIHSSLSEGSAWAAPHPLHPAHHPVS